MTALLQQQRGVHILLCMQAHIDTMQQDAKSLAYQKIRVHPSSHQTLFLARGWGLGRDYMPPSTTKKGLVTSGHLLAHRNSSVGCQSDQAHCPKSPAPFYLTEGGIWGKWRKHGRNSRGGGVGVGGYAPGGRWSTI